MQRMIFVNLPVKDLEVSKAFYAGLGFSFNPMFTTADCAYVVVEENIALMLLTEARFKDFIKGEIADPAKGKQALICFSAEGREEVDGYKSRALSHGGGDWMPNQDFGFMYGTSFTDPDGHVLEVCWMDVEAAKQSMSAPAAA
ncbi:MAG: lactoylglutathione lyase [Caulobacteraceae bacterium]|nr:lactoylglutathione lyase [Caulobacteraceae bacterium]